MNTARPLALATILAGVSWSSSSFPAIVNAEARCVLDAREVPPRPAAFEAIVLGIVPPERVRTITEHVEKEAGARISPDYAGLPRILVRASAAGRTFQTIAAVVDGRIPRPGEHVQLLSRYRDPRFPCHFIPWTIGAPNAVS